MGGKCIWITGLPGSGKTSAALKLKELAAKEGMHFHNLEMDSLRKLMIAHPRYDEDERELAYALLGFMAGFLAMTGRNVIVDATAHRRKYRDSARKGIDDFTEIHISAPVELCMERETGRERGAIMGEMYRKALERKRDGREFPGLGDVIGIDVPYEKGGEVEITMSSENMGAERIAEVIWSSIRVSKGESSSP